MLEYIDERTYKVIRNLTLEEDIARRTDFKFLKAIQDWESNLRDRLKNRFPEESAHYIRWVSLEELAGPISEYLDNTQIFCEDQDLMEVRVKLLMMCRYKMNLAASLDKPNAYED